MKRYTAILIDDDPFTLDQLQHLFRMHFPEIRLAAIAMNGKEGIQAITTLQPEIIFLDIEMPDMSGFDMLSGLEHINFEIVFITSFDQYAIKAIRFSAIDYLLKPVHLSELTDAIERFKNKTTIDADKRVGNFLHNHKMEQLKFFRLAINTTEGTHLLNTDDIIRCEGDVNYTRFYIQGQSPVLASRTLKEYDELLNEHQFIRVHRAHLVNRKYITAITPQHKLKLRDGTLVDISKRKFPEVKELLNI